MAVFSLNACRRFLQAHLRCLYREEVVKCGNVSRARRAVRAEDNKSLAETG